MLTEQQYTANPSQIINGLEDLAESFMDPRYRSTNYTIRGIIHGESRDPQKILLPDKYRTQLHFQMTTGINFPAFANLLHLAEGINDELTERLSIAPRFNLWDLVQKNLGQDETAESVLTEFGVLGRDDYLWFLTLRYSPDSLLCRIGDNTQWTEPDEQFKSLYERFFGKYFHS